MEKTMKAVVYKGKGQVVLEDRPVPMIQDPRDAIVRVTRSTICSSDLHIKHGTVPRAKENTVLGHEFVGEVVEVGSAVKKFKAGMGSRYIWAMCDFFGIPRYDCVAGDGLDTGVRPVEEILEDAKAEIDRLLAEF